MKNQSEINWREKAKAHLESKNLLKCHLKFREPNTTGRYTNFGIVFGSNILTIFLIDKKGDITFKKLEFNSIDEMLDAGWDVD